jgi:hypothetical protein
VFTPKRDPSGLVSSVEARVAGALWATGQLLRYENDGRAVIEETHFSPSGSIVYKGELVFDVNGHPIQSESRMGAKANDIFESWNW